MQGFAQGFALVGLGFVLGLLYGFGSGPSAAPPLRVTEHRAATPHALGAGADDDAVAAVAAAAPPTAALPPSATAPPAASAAVAAAAAAVATSATTSAETTEPEPPFLLLGVISSPASFGRRAMLRDFAARASGGMLAQAHVGGRAVVRTEFVFGRTFYERPPSADVQRRLAAEAAQYGDVVFVDGRERLPHVGKATEKSAAW